MRIKTFEENFYKQLPTNSFVAQYIPWYKLINSVSYIAQNKPQEIPATLNELRNINLSNTYFYNSGLLTNTIDMQISLILKHFGNNPRGTAELKISIDYILNSLINDEEKLNAVADYLFEKLEQKSLTESSEYLATQLLNQNSCEISDDLTKQLEIYRKMKIGNTAPTILFNGLTYKNGNEISEKGYYALGHFAFQTLTDTGESLYPGENSNEGNRAHVDQYLVHRMPKWHSPDDRSLGRPSSRVSPPTISIISCDCIEGPCVAFPDIVSADPDNLFYFLKPVSKWGQLFIEEAERHYNENKIAS